MQRLFYPTRQRWSNLVAIIIIGAFLTTSCKKKLGDVPTLSTNELLTTTHWKLKNLFLADSPYVQRGDVTSFYYNPCELNDVYDFKTTNILSRKSPNNATNCTVQMPLLPGDGAAWTLSADEKNLIIEMQSYTNPYFYNCSILNISSSSMELEAYFRNYFNKPSSYIFLFNSTP